MQYKFEHVQIEIEREINPQELFYLRIHKGGGSDYELLSAMYTGVISGKNLIQLDKDLAAQITDDDFYLDSYREIHIIAEPMKVVDLAQAVDTFSSLLLDD